MTVPIRILITIVFAVLLIETAFAQTTTTGTIEGVITDTNGALVSGITVTASSPNLIRTQSSTTDTEGRFRLQNLPPGNYVVIAESGLGFARLVKANIAVNL